MERKLCFCVIMLNLCNKHQIDMDSFESQNGPRKYHFQREEASPGQHQPVLERDRRFAPVKTEGTIEHSYKYSCILTIPYGPLATALVV